MEQDKKSEVFAIILITFGLLLLLGLVKCRFGLFGKYVCFYILFLFNKASFLIPLYIIYRGVLVFQNKAVKQVYLRVPAFSGIFFFFSIFLELVNRPKDWGGWIGQVIVKGLFGP